MRGWQPSLVLGLRCGDDYVEMPVIALRHLVRERVLAVPTRWGQWGLRWFADVRHSWVRPRRKELQRLWERAQAVTGLSQPTSQRRVTASRGWRQSILECPCWGGAPKVCERALGLLWQPRLLGYCVSLAGVGNEFCRHGRLNHYLYTFEFCSLRKLLLLVQALISIIFSFQPLPAVVSSYFVWKDFRDFPGIFACPMWNIFIYIYYDYPSWRIIPFSKWDLQLRSASPQDLGCRSPSKWP